MNLGRTKYHFVNSERWTLDLQADLLVPLTATADLLYLLFPPFLHKLKPSLHRGSAPLKLYAKKLSLFCICTSVIMPSRSQRGTHAPRGQLPWEPRTWLVYKGRRAAPLPQVELIRGRTPGILKVLFYIWLWISTELLLLWWFSSSGVFKCIQIGQKHTFTTTHLSIRGTSYQLRTHPLRQITRPSQDTHGICSHVL